MTPFTFHKTLFSPQIDKFLPRTKSNPRQWRILIPALGSCNNFCLMSLFACQTTGFARLPSHASQSDATLLRHLVSKDFLHTDVVANDATAETLSVELNSQGVVLQTTACSRGAAKPIDHRLLTGKLGGWGHQLSVGVASSPHRGGVKRLRQKVFLPVNPRALPSYLIKFVNQLMRDGKKSVSVGLLADSLTLFCKKLKEGGRSNLQTGGARSANLLKEGNGQGPRISRPHRDSASNGKASIALQRIPSKASQPQPIPSFPFYLFSFPGPSSGELFYSSKGELGSLLAFPLSGGLSPHLSPTRVFYANGGSEHRGSLGFKVSQGVMLQSYTCCASPAKPSTKTLQSNGLLVPKTFSLNESPTLNQVEGLRRDRRPARAEAGVKRHTTRPIYFWPMKGPSALALHSSGTRAKGPLPSLAAQAASRLGSPRLAIEPQASTLQYLGLAISNIEPSLEVRKKKIAGITRQIPCVVPKARGERLAIRWIIDSARERVRKRGKHHSVMHGLPSCLAEELVDAYYKRGEPRQKRDSLHKTAESNRSFLRYRWW